MIRNTTDLFYSSPPIIIGSIIPARIPIDVGLRICIDIGSRSIVSIRIGLDIASIDRTQYPEA